MSGRKVSSGNIIQEWTKKLKDPKKRIATLNKIFPLLEKEKNRVILNDLIPILCRLLETKKGILNTVNVLSRFIKDNDDNAKEVRSKGEKLLPVLWEFVGGGNEKRIHAALIFVMRYATNGKDMKKDLYYYGFVEKITELLSREILKKEFDDYMLYYGLYAISRIITHKHARPKFLKKGGLNLLYMLVKMKNLGSFELSATIEILGKVSDYLDDHQGRLFMLFLGRHLDDPNNDWLDELLQVLMDLDFREDYKTLFEFGIAQRLVQLLDDEKTNAHYILKRFCTMCKEKQVIIKKLVDLGILKHLKVHVLTKPRYYAISIRFLSLVASMKNNKLKMDVILEDGIVDTVCKIVSSKKENVTLEVKKNGLSVFSSLMDSEDCCRVLASNKTVVSVIYSCLNVLIRQIIAKKEESRAEMMYTSNAKDALEYQLRVCQPYMLLFRYARMDELKKLQKLRTLLPEMMSSSSMTLRFHAINSVWYICQNHEKMSIDILPELYKPLITAFINLPSHRLTILKLLMKNFDIDEELVGTLEQNKSFLMILKKMSESDDIVKKAWSYFENVSSSSEEEESDDEEKKKKE